MTRADLLLGITEDVRELTIEVRTSVAYDIDGTRGVRRHWQRHHGLLLQLVASLPPGAATGTGRSGRPGARSPINDAAGDTLDAITHGWAGHGGWTPGVHNLHSRLRTAAGQNGTPRRPQSLTGALTAAHGCVSRVDETHLVEAARAIHAYSRLAKTTLAYDVPIATLRDVVCLHCHGPLRVANDASSDVWCANPGCHDDEGRRRVWARSTWPFLLEQMSSGNAA
jgi:hypothetical protein